MKEHTEQHLDNLAKKMMQSSLESPSKEFTANIMAKLEQSVEAKAVTYKPLISKLGWLGIAAVLTGIALFVFYGNAEPISWLESVELGFLTDNKVSETVSGISFSNVMMYAVVMFGLLWLVQVQLVKRQIEQQLNY